jgi:CRISPR-associated protein Cas5t
MECLRVKLYTPVGIFKTPLSIKGIETYPLPSYSTVIGLIYSAMGRKWNGEYFQISIQGDYKALFRDYVWFKKYESKEKTVQHPLQVPILYDLHLLIHIRADEDLLSEIEKGLREPETLLFLSGGEFLVKIEEVKRVKYYEKIVSRKDEFLLKYNVYIPSEVVKDLSFSRTDEGAEQGILYTLPYFYKNLEKPRIFSYVEVYYFLKGTQVYGPLMFDEDGDVIFWADPHVEEEVRGKRVGSEEEYIKFYAGNWLMASACVGVLKVLENAGEDVKKYVEGRFLKIPKGLWNRLPELYADYLLRDKERVRVLLEREYGKKEGEINPFSVLITKKFSDFYHNSVFTNPSSIGKFKEGYSGNLEEILREVKEQFLEVCERLFQKEREVSGTCFFCFEREAKNYVDATTFTPLFASLETARNFVWDPIGICKECEFLIYFAWVGFYREPSRGESNRRYLFVYYPDNLLETYRTNSGLSGREGIERDRFLGLFDIVRHTLEIERRRNEWVLENIYLVEIEKVSNTTANIYSFHIRPSLAKAIRNLINEYPRRLWGIFFEFLFYAYTGRSLYEFLLLLLSGFFYKKRYEKLEADTIDARIVKTGTEMDYLGPSLLFFINFQEVMNMNEQNISFTDRAFRAGRALKRLYNENERSQKKLEALTYRLLEAVRRKDKEYFIHNLIRAYLEVEKEIPSFFKEALEDKNFSMIAYAFLIGLNSEEKTKAEEAIEETTSEGEITESA